MFSIYWLIEPSSHTVFYIGRTGREAMVRPQVHLNEPHTFSLKFGLIVKYREMLFFS